MNMLSFARRAWRQSQSFGRGILWLPVTIAVCWAIFGRPDWLG